MLKLGSPDDLKNYCFRALGSPVINIEISPVQANDRIDDALQWFTERHIDGATEQFVKVTFTSADAARQTIRLPEEFIAVTEVIDPTLNSGSGREDFDRLRYLVAQSDYFDFSRKGGRNYDLLSYDLTMQYISLMNMYFQVRRNFSFNKMTHQIMVPSGSIVEGNWFIVRGYLSQDPEKAVDIFNDEWVKRYSTALMKKQWGNNLSKYDGVQMVGGVTLNGTRILEEAVTEIDKLHEEFERKYGAPLGPMWG